MGGFQEKVKLHVKQVQEMQKFLGNLHSLPTGQIFVRVSEQGTGDGVCIGDLGRASNDLINHCEGALGEDPKADDLTESDSWKEHKGLLERTMKGLAETMVAMNYVRNSIKSIEGGAAAARKRGSHAKPPAPKRKRCKYIDDEAEADSGEDGEAAAGGGDSEV